MDTGFDGVTCADDEHNDGGLEGDREEVLGNDIDGVVGADDEDEDCRQYG